MSINYNVLLRLLRENFKGQAPMRATLADKDTIANQARQRLQGLNYVNFNQRGWISNQDDKNRYVLYWGLSDPDRFSFGYYNNFALYINTSNQLEIKCHSDTFLVSHLDELVTFVRACQEQIERKAAQRKKQEKIRDLKAQAILAQVKKLAAEENFTFATETDTVKLILYVQLSEKEAIHIHIPFNKFQEFLPQLRKTIALVRELYGQGLKFKMGQYRSWLKWTSPNNQSDEVLDDE